MKALQFFCLLFCLSCIKAEGEFSNSSLTNVQIFPFNSTKVWQTTLDVIQYDFLIPIEIADSERGYFASQMIREDQTSPMGRYRISGTITAEGQGTVVKLYKHQQVINNNQWKTVPSNLVLENKILNRLQKKLVP
jgi:hypothetical protein